jgi:hypothetical protein
MADMIAGSVKSETALPANPQAADRLAKAIAEVSMEKPSEVGATPALADAISGKTYTFPDGPLGLKSLTLFLSDPEPRYQAEIYSHDSTNSSISLDGPIGLDGLYRKSKPGNFGLRAVKGSWVDDQTFAVDFQYVGLGEQRRWSLKFDGDKVTLSGKSRDGRDISVDSAPPG